MEHFQIDTVFIIGYAEQIAVVSVRADIAARELGFFFDSRCRLSVFFEIMPEHAPAQPQVESGELGQDNIQRLLEQVGLDEFGEGDADAVDIAHPLPCDDGEEVGGVVQLLPAYVPVPPGAGMLFAFFAHMCKNVLYFKSLK